MALDQDILVPPYLADTSAAGRLSAPSHNGGDVTTDSGSACKETVGHVPGANRHVRSALAEPLTFDPAELLQRQPVIAYGAEARQMFSGKRVLVTGAGGSIGSELVRQVNDLRPDMLYLLDRDESLMHGLQLEVFGNGQLDNERTILADIRDGRRLSKLFRQVEPDLIFHAAAHKHLAILERYPSEAVRTNTLGTENVIRASKECGAERLTFISTDKAADPISILGASKRIAEALVRRGANSELRAASVRFGNVLGSRGSFLDTLDHQVRAGIPVTVTHPLVERFFMSIPEAAALVIEASVEAAKGETYFLDMGTPIRIVDLIARFLESNALPPPEIRFTGLVPGEKLSERLIDSNTMWIKTKHPRIWQVPFVDESLLSLDRLRQLYAAANLANEDAVREELWACTGMLAAVAGQGEERTA